MAKAVAAARGTDYLDLRGALAGHEVCAAGTAQVPATGPECGHRPPPGRGSCHGDRASTTAYGGAAARGPSC